jgi:hypothetical protein
VDDEGPQRPLAEAGLSDGEITPKVPTFTQYLAAKRPAQWIGDEPSAFIGM